jgi:hypothetical protein
MGERFGLNGSSQINDGHPMERKPIIIGFWRVDVYVEGQQIMRRPRDMSSIVMTKCTLSIWGQTTDRSDVRSDTKPAHNATLKSRRFVPSVFSMQVKEGWK